MFTFIITAWEWKWCEQSRNVNKTLRLVSAKQTVNTLVQHRHVQGRPTSRPLIVTVCKAAGL